MSTHTIRVAVAGAYGRTGAAVAQALANASGLELVGRLVKSGQRKTPQDHESVQELKAQCSPQVLVDFTVFPDSMRLALAALESGIRPVIGTSGYQPEDIATLRATCERARIGAVLAANFSPGAALMMRFATTAAPFFDSAEIVETHPVGKKDAPSGTALATAQRLGAVKTFTHPHALLENASGARGADVAGIGVHSLRLPGVIANQDVALSNGDEMLIIRHVTLSRSAFVPGVLRAVRAVMNADRLIVGIDSLLA